MITLEHVLYIYKEFPMEFSFTVPKSDCVSIMGPSGAGKSTLLSLIAGFLSPEQGNIILGGKKHNDTSPAERPVSILFQDNNLFPHLTLEQNIGLGLNPGLHLNKDDKEKLLTIAEDVNILDILHRKPDQVSGGQRQRAALARCLLRDQPILLLDEPFSALDTALRLDILDLIKEIQKEKTLTILMVSHNIDDSIRLSERCLLIDKGKIIYDGSISELQYSSPREAKILGIHNS